MSSLPLAVQETDDAILKYKEKIVRYKDYQSNAFDDACKTMIELKKRRELLLKFTKELAERVQLAEQNFQKKLEDLHGDLRQTIDDIVQEYEDMTAELPAIKEVGNVARSVAEQEKLAKMKVTDQTVKEYSMVYFDEYKRHPDIDDNFFHAISCSGHLKYVKAPSDDSINSAAKELMALTTLPTMVEHPLSLTDMDKIIHSLADKQLKIAILDTRLRVILINFPKIMSSPNICFLSIYDATLNLYVPISCGRKDEKFICANCFRFDFRPHKCQRHCPFCLREGEPSRCFKPSPESEAFICSKCGAFCQTETCYKTHRKMCFLNVQQIHDDVLQLMKNLINNSSSNEENEYKNDVSESLNAAKNFEKPHQPNYITSSTVQTIQNYVTRYSEEYKHIPEERNFFHAVGCSRWGKYIITPSPPNSPINNFANDLLFKAKLLTNLQYPLSLKDIDKIIHAFKEKERIFIILDTSLRVILTNLRENLGEYYTYFLIYDSVSNRFTPVPYRTKDKNTLCMECFRFDSLRHNRERQCPICLRKSGVFKCFKQIQPPFWFTWCSDPLICPKCNAFCQTEECYDAHRRICPLPAQGIYKDILQVITSTFI